MECYALHRGVAAAFDLIDATNEFIASTQPWVVAKDQARAAELDQQLYEIGEAVRIAALLLLPVMPTSCAEVLARVGEPRDPAALRLDHDGNWSTGAARVVAKADPLWPRLEPSKETVTVTDTDTPPQATPAATSESTPEPTPLVSIDDFAKLDLRVGRVIAAEPVPTSRKLLKVQLDTGTEERQVVAGFAGVYEPEALVGRTIVFIANLQPAKLVGVESNGMILAASTANGKPVLLTVDNPEAAPPGSKVS